LTPTVPHPEEEDDENEKGEESCYEKFEQVAEHHITLFGSITTMRFETSQGYVRMEALRGCYEEDWMETGAAE